jgi:hypothetical protein
MNKKRLLKLADLLEADAKNKKGIKFNMGTWGDIYETDNLMSCGTKACAMGLAALSGAFKRAGLGYNLTRYPDLEYCPAQLNITFSRNGYTHHGGIVSAMHLFDLTDQQAEALFTPNDLFGGTYTGAEAERHLAKLIRKFVAGKLEL